MAKNNNFSDSFTAKVKERILHSVNLTSNKPTRNAEILEKRKGNFIKQGNNINAIARSMSDLIVLIRKKEGKKLDISDNQLASLIEDIIGYRNLPLAICSEDECLNAFSKLPTVKNKNSEYSNTYIVDDLDGEIAKFVNISTANSKSSSIETPNILNKQDTKPKELSPILDKIDKGYLKISFLTLNLIEQKIQEDSLFEFDYDNLLKIVKQSNKIRNTIQSLNNN